MARVLAATIHASDVHCDSIQAEAFVRGMAEGMAKKLFPDFDWPVLLQEATHHFPSITKGVKVEGTRG